jgi:hypothetical protein
MTILFETIKNEFRVEIKTGVIETSRKNEHPHTLRETLYRDLQLILSPILINIHPQDSFFFLL